MSNVRFKIIILIFFIIFINACAKKESENKTSISAGQVTFYGAATKGPLSGSIISVYAMDALGQKSGSSLAETTSANGSWTISVPNPNNEILLVESDGGEYIDESDPEPDITKKRKIILQAGDILQGILVPGYTTASINFFTDMSVKTMVKELSTSTDLIQAFNRVRSRMFNILGFDSFTEIPADPIQPDSNATDIQKTYALLIGGAAYAINNAAIRAGQTQITYTMIDVMAKDMADCQLDGVINSIEIFNIFSLPEDLYVDLDINNEILRFRNNNYEQYVGVSLPSWNDAELCEVSPVLSLVLPSN